MLRVSGLGLDSLIRLVGSCWIATICSSWPESGSPPSLGVVGCSGEIGGLGATLSCWRLRFNFQFFLSFYLWDPLIVYQVGYLLSWTLCLVPAMDAQGLVGRVQLWKVVPGHDLSRAISHSLDPKIPIVRFHGREREERLVMVVADARVSGHVVLAVGILHQPGAVGKMLEALLVVHGERNLNAVPRSME